MKKLLNSKSLLLILGVIVGSNVFGCDCLWGGSFLGSENKSDIIFVGEIISYDGYSYIEKDDTSYYSPSIMIISLKEVIYKKDGTFTYMGNIKTKEGMKIRVLGNINNNCSPNVDDFKIGSQWIFRMDKAHENNYFGIDLTVSNCATNYLEIKDGKVFGNIEGENQKNTQDAVDIEISIDDLRKKILAICNDNNTPK